MDIDVKYYVHSGFSVAMNGVLLLFDYWLGENGCLPERERITTDELRQYEEIYVFISHRHPDHYDPAVLAFGEELPVNYIIGDDLPVDVPANRLRPGDYMSVSERMTVYAYDSTDLGVSWLVELDGFRIFHAGDLNFWHWREESTIQEIEEADNEFRTLVQPIEGQDIDLCFFPVDPRQGRLFDAGANYFMMTVRPRLMVPMHFWDMTDVVAEYARRNRSLQTEIVPLLRMGETMHLALDDEGYMTVTVHNRTPGSPDIPEAEPTGDVDISGYDGNDPFFNTDEPVDLQ